MNRKSLLPFMTLFCLVFLAACAGRLDGNQNFPAVPPSTIKPSDHPLQNPINDTQASTALTLSDSTGNTITLQSAPKRIVIAGRASALIADAVYLFPQAIDRVVAVSGTNQGSGDFLDLVDPNFQQKIAYDINAGAEQVVTARPDLVIMKSYMAETLGKPLQTLEIPALYLDLETPEQYQQDIQLLGKVFGDSERAEKITAYYRYSVDEIQASLNGMDDSEKSRVLLLYYTSRDGEIAFNVPPLGWMQTIITNLAGAIPAWQDIEFGQGWTKVNLEQLAAWDADRIFIISYSQKASEVTANLKNDPQWQEFRAVKNNHLYAFPSDYYSWDQPDVRWLLGLKWLAWVLHPEKFSDFDQELEARRFFENWYNISPETFDQHLKPRIFRSTN